MTDKKSCNHLIGWFWDSSVSEGEDWSISENIKAFVYKSDKINFDLEQSFDFCPLCGSPLKGTGLDRLILKVLKLEDCSELFPGQMVEDLIEALAVAPPEVKDFQSYLSFDKLEDGNYEVSYRATEFKDKSLKLASAKALLWAITELTVEEVEELFQKVNLEAC
jgi:hypothetical protein